MGSIFLSHQDLILTGTMEHKNFTLEIIALKQKTKQQQQQKP